jgi:sarcosine oxidase subunit beta
MKTTADAVVIGGGILGASTAHFLAKLGFGDVVLLEPRALAGVSTGHSAAAIRTAYSNPVTAALARRCLEMVLDAEERLGGGCDFERVGYLVLTDEDEVEAGRQVAAIERQHGIEVEDLTPEEIAARWPQLRLDGVAYGLFEPHSGYVDPIKTTRNLVDSARAWGLDAHEGVGATGIVRSGDRVEAVQTTEGTTISARVVVNAAGGWGRIVAGWVGLNYSFRWSRESDLILELPFDTGHLPWVSDTLKRQYFRTAGSNRLLAGLGFPKEIEPLDIDDYDPEVDEPTRERILDLVEQRLDLDGSLRVDHGWASMYTITDDWHPLVGAEASVPGYYACVAGSGHGFKLGPPIGESLAAIIAGQTPPIDLHALRPSRFVEGEPLGSVWGGGNRA